MGIVIRHDAAGVPASNDKSRFAAGMQMVARQQAADNNLRLEGMSPLKYDTKEMYKGSKAPKGIADQALGTDPALPPMPAWQEQNSDIMKNIEAGAYSNPVSRQLRDLVTRQQMLMSSQTLNDAQKKDAFDRFERNKRALIEANPLDPSVEVAVRDQQQNAGPSFEQWARTNPKEFNTEFRNTQTKLIEQGVENPTNEQIIQAMRQPWDAMRSMSQPKPSQPPAAAVGDDNPYDSKLDEVLNELQKQQGIGERRYGGPVYPGQTVTVGEEGPEMMRVGYDGVAQVAPNPATLARMQGSMANRKRMNALETFRAKPEVYKDYLSRADVEADKLGVALSAQQRMQRAKELWDMEDAFLNGEEAPVKHRRMGGLVYPNEEYVVGEGNGPEELTMGPGVGYVTPNPKDATTVQNLALSDANAQGVSQKLPLANLLGKVPQQAQGYTEEELVDSEFQNWLGNRNNNDPATARDQYFEKLKQQMQQELTQQMQQNTLPIPAQRPLAGLARRYEPYGSLYELAGTNPVVSPQSQQAQPKAEPLEGMTQRQMDEMYAYNRAQQNAAPATASDRAKMQQQNPQKYASKLEYEKANPVVANDAYLGSMGTGGPRWDGKMPPTAEQSRERYQQWEKDYDQWKRTTANALYMERPILEETPSIGKPRVWTDNKGRKITGELRGFRHFNDADPSISDVAVIRRDDGQTFVIPLETLIPEDQAFVTATPDYASEMRIGGKNLGTYDSFDPNTPEGQRSRQPQPRQTPTPEQLETRRTNEFGFGGVDAGIREGRLGRRRETPPAYQQPVLGDGKIATVPGIASPPGTRTVGPNGERLPPAGANLDPRDVNTYTQWLAHLGPKEGAKFTEALKNKGLWGSRYSITEKLLAQEGLLKKRGVDGYGKPYKSPSDELQFQPPARPAYWDSWKDSTAQERRLTPAELAQRGLMVNPQGQVVQMPRDPQGRPVMPATTSPQTAAQTAAQPAAQTPAKKFDPTSPMASNAIKTLMREHTEKEREDNLRILAELNAPADFIASLTGRTIKPGEAPAVKPEEPGFSITDPQDRSPLDVLRRAIGLRGSSTSQGEPSSQEPTQKDIEGMTAYLQSGRASAEEKQIITDILRNAGVNVNDIKTSASPAKPPTAPQQGFPTPDAMASQVAQQQTQTTPSKSSLINQEKAVQSKPLTLPKEQPALQDQFWNDWWRTQPAAYQAPEDQDPPIVELTSADGNSKLKGTIELISNPIEEIGGQRVITFRRKDGALMTFYSGQLSEEDQSRLAAKAAISKKGFPTNSDAKERKNKMTPEKKKDSPQKYQPRNKYPTKSRTV